MNAKRPAEARREEAPGGRHSKRSHPRRQSTATEFAEALELRERLAAIVDEISLLDADTDVPRTIALGLLDDVERERGAADGSPGNRRISHAEALRAEENAA